MKLDRLKIFHKQLKQEISKDSVEVYVYFYYENSWHDLETEDKCTEEHSVELEKSRGQSIAHYAPSSFDAWYFLKSFDYAVRLKFTKSPQVKTRKTYRQKILAIEEVASNAYKVSHNPLTQLLARDAFRGKLLDAIADYKKPSAPLSLDAQESGIPSSLAVMALDIDHFKQVNDTWGHLYGDQVLKAFGRRLEECAAKIRQDGIGCPEIYLGHPSGEEFLIVIKASALRDQFVEWGNEFRKAIADSVLPTDDEWQWLSRTGATGSLTPPPLQERVTTTSIGIVLHNSAGSSDRNDAVADILDRADTALYRAKSAGRNMVIAFDEILSNCGRVLEHDANTRVVALDVGSNVGVSIGQEFKVYLPTFTGKTSFLINDGRTKRTLGNYPRVESARIVVFNTQPEISFAFIAEPVDSALVLHPGSHLEAIPAGSIGHLLPSFSKYFGAAQSSADNGGLRALQAFVESGAKNPSPFAIVIRFSKESDYLRKYGSVALNMALAQLYREAQVKFHSAKAIEVIERGSICIVGTNENFSEKIANEFVEKMASALPELSVVAGIFCAADQESIKEGQGELIASNAIEFARFAASDAAQTKESRIKHFNYAIAVSILNTQRNSGSYKTAYADFNQLRLLGVESETIFNMGGLITSGLGMHQKALDYFSAAMTKSPKTLIFKSNYGTAAFQLGEIDTGLKVLNDVSIKDIDKLAKIHPFGYFVYACLLARAKLNESSHFHHERFLHVAETAIKLPEFENLKSVGLIRQALAMV